MGFVGNWKFEPNLFLWNVHTLKIINTVKEYLQDLYKWLFAWQITDKVFSKDVLLSAILMKYPSVINKKSNQINVQKTALQLLLPYYNTF